VVPVGLITDIYVPETTTDSVTTLVAVTLPLAVTFPLVSTDRTVCANADRVITGSIRNARILHPPLCPTGNKGTEIVSLVVLADASVPVPTFVDGGVVTAPVKSLSIRLAP
jgi:hypothetical protein